MAAQQQVWRLGGRALRLGDRAAALAETQHAAAVVFVVALGLWWLRALVLPLGPGRDLGTYLGAYVQLFQSDAIDLGYVLGRTPVASVIVGGLLELGGGVLAEPVISLLYAGSIVAWFLAARRFSGRAALATAVLLLAYPGYGIIFHELSSDAVFAAAFAGWSLLVVRVLFSPSAAGFALVGTGVGILSLIRPGNQVLLVLALVPLLWPWSRRERLVSAAVFLAPALVLLGGWAVHNGVRYDNFTVARGGNATVPFYRTFVTDRIVEPSNGPASRELAAAVQADLLGKEPYRSYRITLHDFFTDASSRMEVDLLTLSDRRKGWHSNFGWLRDVGIEAVKAHPLDYAAGVASSTWGLLTKAVFRSPAPPDDAGGLGDTADNPAIGGGTLPKPSEGEPIPAPHEGGVTTPDASIYTVWTSPTEHHLVFVHPGDEQRYDDLHRRMDELAHNLPTRDGSPTLEHRLNQASRWFPPPVLWLVLGLVALAVRRPRGTPALLIPAAAGVIVIVFSALGLPAEPHYSVPVAPAFLLLAAAVVFAPPRRWAPVPWRVRARRLVPAAGAAAGVVAGLWALWAYGSMVQARLADDGAPHDLAVFLRAAENVLDGSSPYFYDGDRTYAYPPLLAILAVPFHVLGPGVATLLWTVLSLAAIGLALWLLGVRDWRCYALAAVFPFTRSAVELGTIGPLLLLSVAAAWRWRDRVVRGAAAAGAAVALKLFLWPVAAWLALTGRARAAVATVGFALAFVLVPWAAIGFDGLRAYPGLLERLSDDEATSSYSVLALGVRAHLPEAIALALSLVVGAALLAAAVWAARARQGSSMQDRDVAVLTLTLAAGLAVSPIVWVHYFLLLLVPLALTRPRLSALWFVPFAYYPLGLSAWPAGDARKLAVALAATLAIVAVTLAERLRPGLKWHVE